MGVRVRTPICIMANPHWRLKACQDQWLKSWVCNSSNDLVVQGVKGLSNSIRENICLHVLETGCVYLLCNSSLNQSLAEALGHAADALSSRIVQDVLVQRPFGLSGQGDCFYRAKKKSQRLKWRMFDLRSVIPSYCFSFCCCRSEGFPLFFIRYLLYSVCAEYG